MKRFIVSAACLVLLLGGCVTAPREPVLLGSHGLSLAASRGCADNPHVVPAPALDPDGFSLASWNLYKQQRQGWRDELDALTRDTDILLLQEAALQPELFSWLGERELAWDMTPAFSWRGAHTGVMTLGRGESLQTCAHLELEPWLRLPKSLLASFYPINGRETTLLVVNLHAVNFTVGTDSLVAQLQSAATLIEAHRGPLIVAGDFNTWSPARMAAVDGLARDWQLQALQFEGQQPAVHLGRTVDHIYYRGLSVLSGEVRRVDSSDHYPLQARFAVERS
jgi:endonuclease/exonuclease/phosphatase (EEP) superfamily protein YafD